jgi:2-keto-4-pentenoate hydratase
MHAEEHSKAAALLDGAYASRQAVPPLSAGFPGMDIADAYAVQQLQLVSWRAAGRVVRGHKVGLTSAAMQRQLGVSEPDYGVLLADMFHAEGSPIDTSAFLAPRIEPEIAFVLRRDLAGPGANAADAAAAVDFVLPALEIIDSRIADWRITLVDTIADNASSGGVVLGSRPTPLGALDLRVTGCNLYRGGDVVATGAGGAVLGSPLIALAWLANTLGRYGEVLRAGQVVLPGSVTSAQPVQPGDTFAGVSS